MKSRSYLPRLLPVFFALSLTAMAQPPAAPKPKLGSAVFNWARMQARPTANGERRDVADNPTATASVFECHITTLNPGVASHAPHRHPQEELIIVKEGTVEAHINGQTQVVGPGSVFFFAHNDAHAARNVGTTPATYFVVNLTSTATNNPAAQTKNPTLKSAVYDWSKLEVAPNKTGERRAILSGSSTTLASLSVHATTVNPGEASHAAHRHPDEEVIIVREGTLEVTINGESQRAGPGSIFFYGSNDLHGMRNVGDTKATYHVIRFVTAATPKEEPAAAKK
jgi:quercetin dioxygenase-like cupin family protein